MVQFWANFGLVPLISSSFWFRFILPSFPCHFKYHISQHLFSPFRLGLRSQPLNPGRSEEVHKQDGQLPLIGVPQAECHAGLGLQRRRITYSHRSCRKQGIFRVIYWRCPTCRSCYNPPKKIVPFTGTAPDGCFQRHFSGQHESSQRG